MTRLSSCSQTSLLPLLALALLPGPAAAAASWPRGEVVVPTSLFDSGDDLDKVVLESNPRLYLPKELDLSADLILVVGMPGWGGRSENFIGVLYNGLTDPALRKRLVLATIQDPLTRGPRYQGQGDRAHANVWRVDKEAVAALRHFVERLAGELGHLRVYMFGYSSGSVTAPVAAARIAELGPGKQFKMEGSISLGTGSGISAQRLNAAGLRALFMVVPPRRTKEAKSSRYDQGNRDGADRAFARLSAAGAKVYLRHIQSARRHIDWHWGLMSQCRYYRVNRYDKGRGYWPNYWMPNPETFGHMAAFIQGREPAESLSPPPQRCPHPPNPDNPDDPDYKVFDTSRQPRFAPGTE